MSTITRERAEIKSYITGFLSDSAHDNKSSDSLLANGKRKANAVCNTCSLQTKLELLLN